MFIVCFIVYFVCLCVFIFLNVSTVFIYIHVYMLFSLVDPAHIRKCTVILYCLVMSK